MEVEARKLNTFLKLALAILCFSCNDQTSNLGADFVQSSTFDIGVTDTLTLNVSTVLFDSLKTNNPDKLLLGYTNDEKLGPVTASPVFQLTPQSVTQLDKNFTTYEALRLTFKTSGFYYYDTTASMLVKVHKVTDELKLYNGGKFNTSNFTIDPSPIGSLIFSPRPRHIRDSVEIPLSDIMGREIFKLLQQGDDQVLQSGQFLKYLRGLAIIPDKTQNTSILGLNPAIELRVYYYDKSVLPSKEKHVSFTAGSSINFNSIVANRSASPVKNLKTLKNPVSSIETGNAAFIQSGTGLGIRVQIPHLRDLLITDGTFSASSAVLEMSPIKGYRTKTTPIPLSLVGYIVDGQNSILSNSTYSAVLVDDNENLERNVRYNVDITSFINQQLLTDVNNDNALLFLINDTNFRNTIARLAVGDSKSAYQMKLSLYFVSLSKNK